MSAASRPENIGRSHAGSLFPHEEQKKAGS